MKKLFLLLSIFVLFIGCDNPNESIVYKIIEVNKPTILTPEEEKEVEFIYEKDNKILTNTGKTLFENEKLAMCGNYVSQENILYKQNGQNVKYLCVSPDVIFIDNSEWLATVEPVGSKYKYKLYKDSVLIKDEIDGYELKSIFKLGGEIFGHFTSAIGSRKGVCFSNSSLVIYYYSQNLIIDTNNYVYTKYGKELANQSTNYPASNAIEYQEAGGKFYTGRNVEYKFNEGFTETGETSLSDFLEGRQRLYKAGNRVENGEEVAYFVESTSAKLLKYIPSIDQYFFITQLYTTPASYSDANIKAQKHNSFWVDKDFYYNYEGNLYKYNIETGINSFVMVETNICLWCN